MFLSLLVLVLAAVSAHRPPLDPCKQHIFLLCDGAPVARKGKTFRLPPQRTGYDDARVADSPRGQRLVDALRGKPECYVKNAIPLKAVGAKGLDRAVAWLDEYCLDNGPCLVLTDMPLLPKWSSATYVNPL
jgi:hypothetical protein